MKSRQRHTEIEQHDKSNTFVGTAVDIDQAAKYFPWWISEELDAFILKFEYVPAESHFNELVRIQSVSGQKSIFSSVLDGLPQEAFLLSGRSAD